MQPAGGADPVLVDHVDSATHARDMEAIRLALGEKKLNYFGNSYGGVIGASYARQFPHRVRSMYLDSVIDHVSDYPTQQRDDLRTKEFIFAEFARWCEATPACRQHGRDVRAEWRALVAAADRAPIPVHGSDPEMRMDGDELVFRASRVAFHEGNWQRFSDAVEQARGGDAAGFAKFGGAKLVIQPAAVAMVCSDGVQFREYERYRAALRLGEIQSPHFGRFYATYQLMCASWPIVASNPPRPLPGDQLPPMLGASSRTERAATTAMLAQVPGSASIETAGLGHNLLYLIAGNQCVINHVNRYFRDQTVPADKTVCPG